MRHLVIIALVSMAATRFAQAQYSFGTQVQSTNTASITYNSGTGAFQYTDAANLTPDFAGLPLAGTPATFITTSNGWSASLTVNLSARSISGNGSQIHAAMGLFVVINNNTSNTIQMALEQENYTGNSSGGNIYGTVAAFEAQTNSQHLTTTPLGNSSLLAGISYQQLSGGTSSTPSTESINAASGVVSFTNDAAAGILTGYFNGAPVGSISLTSWGPKPSVFLAVVGFSGYGVDVLAGTDTASNFSALQITSPPGLLLSTPQVNGSKTNFTFLISGPAGSNYVLQVSTNLLNWSPVITSSIPVSGSINLSNAISGHNQHFYRAYLQ